LCYNVGMTEKEKKHDEYIRHRDKYIKRAKLWRKNNIERARKTSNKLFSNWFKKLKDTRPDYYKYLCTKTYHRRKKAKGTYSFQEWNELLKKHNYSCVYCGSTNNISVDHIIPLSKGGTNYIDNIQPLCLPCNLKKGNKI